MVREYWVTTNDPDLNKWQKMDGWTIASAELEISFLRT